jgi:hypothetical protein
LFISLPCARSEDAPLLAVRTLALRAERLPEVYVKAGESYAPLSFSDVQPGEMVSVLRADPLPLFKRLNGPAGEEIFALAQKVAVPAGAKGILLLGWISGDEAKYAAIADHFGNASFNDWLMINISRMPVAFKVGESLEPLVIPPGSSREMRVNAQKGKGVPVVAQAAIGGRPKTFFSTYWPVHPDKRTLILFFDDGTKIRVKRISDKLPPTDR